MADVTQATKAFLESLQRLDLTALLGACRVTISEFGKDGDWYMDPTVLVAITAPPPVHEALSGLPAHDRKRIAEAAASATDLIAPSDIDITRAPGPAVTGGVALLAELMIQRELMIAVGTGQARIQDVDDYYIARETRLRQLAPPAVAYTNPHPDLWAWYHHWQEHLPTYASRRQYIRTLFAPAIAAAASRPTAKGLPPREPTGWARVDRTLDKARTALDAASAEEDWQAIGLLCREVIISLAQAVYDPDLHESLDGVTPSPTDANRMLDAYIAHVFPGPSHKEVRAHARASLALTLNLQHRRTATPQLAALCVEATGSTVAVIMIIGRPIAAAD